MPWSKPKSVVAAGALAVVLFAGLALLLLLKTASLDARHPISSFDRPVGWAGQKVFDAGKIELKDADLGTVFNIYQDVSGRAVVPGKDTQKVRISLRNQTPLNRVETLQLLDTALALNRVRMVLDEDGTVRAMDWAPATNETVAPKMSALARDLPDSSSFVSVRVTLRKADPRMVRGTLVPFSNLPGSVTVTPYLSFLAACRA